MDTEENEADHQAKRLPRRNEKKRESPPELSLTIEAETLTEDLTL